MIHPHRPLPLAAALLLAAVLPPSHAGAQERQVPFDRAGRIQRVDRALAQRLGLWADSTQGFQEARLFQVSDSSYVLELTSVRAGELVRDRLPLDQTQADALRGRVESRVHEVAPEAMLDQGGRTPLVLGTTLLGLAFYGWSVPVALQVHDANTGVGLYFVTAGASYFLPWIATQDAEVTQGTAILALYGATRGIAHGVIAYELVTNGDTNGNGEGVLGAATLASVGEGALGYAWAQSSDMGDGMATAISACGDFGLLEGVGAASLARRANDNRRAASAAIMLAGSAAGLVGGRILADRRSYSHGDALVMRTVMALGAYAGMAAAAMADDRWNDGYTAAAMAGGGAGLVLGDALVRETEFTGGQAALIDVGTAAAGLFGLGLGYLFSDHVDVSNRVLFGFSALGAAGGFALTYGQFLPQARRANADRSSWNVGLTSVPVAATLAPQRGGRTLMPLAPALAVSCRF